MVKYVSFIIPVQGIPISHKQNIFLRNTQNAGCIDRFLKTNRSGILPIAVRGIYQRNLRLTARKGIKQRCSSINFVILVRNKQ